MLFQFIEFLGLHYSKPAAIASKDYLLIILMLPDFFRANITKSSTHLP